MILLSYIPFRRARNSTLNLDAIMNDSRPEFEKQEGLYGESEGRSLGYHQRQQNQEQIAAFVETVFSMREQLNFKEFLDLNINVSSEMLISVMAILHEKLPCAQFYFRQREIFKQRNPHLMEDGPKGATDNFDNGNSQK